jgi:hypothetical protein
MANAPSTGLRIDPALTAAARAAIGKPDLPTALLVRTGLGVLAGLPVDEALARAYAKPGRPRIR